MLNSSWGKFGENLHKKTTEAVTTSAHLFALVSDTFTDIHTVRICSQDSLEVVYSNLRENQLDNGRVNIFIAAFTTCWVRLKLYSYLEQLQQQVLYFDTDSVIFSWKPGHPDIPLGDFLGEMTNELDDGDYIIDFTSAGPKNYGYKTKNGKVCCKVRGFTLNARGQQQLNYNIMRQNLLEELRILLTNAETSTSSIPISSPDIRPPNSSKWVRAPNDMDWCLTNVWSIRTPSSPILMDTHHLGSMMWT